MKARAGAANAGPFFHAPQSMAIDLNQAAEDCRQLI
jgi:hypothetical protein